MRIWKLMTVFLAAGIIGWLLSSCAPGSDQVTLEQREAVTVQRGDLTLDITAVGNLALSVKSDLAFEIAGTVEEVLVEEGDTVEKAQVLVRLDVSPLEQAIEDAEVALRNKKLDLALAGKAVVSSEIDLQTAVDNFDELAQPYAYYSLTFLADMPEAESAINQAEEQLLKAKEGLQAESGSEQYAAALIDIELALENLAYADERLARNKGTDKFLEFTAWARDYWKLRDASLAVQKSELSLSQNKDRQEKSNLALIIAVNDLETAREALADSVIIAPMDGFVTVVNIDGGDEVKKGTVAMQLANPDKFEADVLVGEIDILQVELGSTAWVQVDALPDLKYPAEVSHISPTATIQSGVVNYQVTVEILSLEAMKEERQDMREEMEEKISSGELPERLSQAVESGRMSQEQAEKMMEQMQSGEMPFPSPDAGGQGLIPPSGSQDKIPSPSAGEQGMPMMPENIQLREGLTVTVNMLISERKNVLLVPNKAITQQGNQAMVQVLKDGVVESRTITTGLSDWQFTEVPGGLSEGEEVLVSGTTATTASTSQQSSPRMPFFGGGVGH